MIEVRSHAVVCDFEDGGKIFAPLSVGHRDDISFEEEPLVELAFLVQESVDREFDDSLLVVFSESILWLYGEIDAISSLETVNMFFEWRQYVADSRNEYKRFVFCPLLLQPLLLPPERDKEFVGDSDVIIHISSFT